MEGVGVLELCILEASQLRGLDGEGDPGFRSAHYLRNTLSPEWRTQYNNFLLPGVGSAHHLHAATAAAAVKDHDDAAVH